MKRVIAFIIQRKESQRQYTFTVSPQATVLDLLEMTRREHHSALLYRHSCHHGSCGACVSACPAVSDSTQEDRPVGHPTNTSAANRFKGPYYCALLYRQRANKPSEGAHLLSLADSADGVWGCERALQCSRVCPQGVAPARKIMELQREVQNRTKRN